MIFLIAGASDPRLVEAARAGDEEAVVARLKTGVQVYKRRRQNSDRFQLFWLPAEFRHRDPAIFRQISLVPSYFRQRHIQRYTVHLYTTSDQCVVSGWGASRLIIFLK